MKITDILNDKKLSLSFEVFPPKTDYTFDTVEKAVSEIAQLHPSYMSVTYGAGGGTSKYTLDIAKEINDLYKVPTLAHLTCVSSSKETIVDRINELKESGIKNVLALRGDIPESMINDDRSKWDFNHASELVALLKESGNDFCIGGACYPEIHPESTNRDDDIAYLKLKAEAGCQFFTTQMFFDNNILFNFLYRIREAGIKVPVVAGIMPITNAKQVDRAIKLSGSHVPQRFISLVDKFGNDPKAMMQAGIAYATDQIIDLYANNISNVHVYTMNKPEVARKIQENLSDIIEK